jgi:hypothetical protein
MHMIFQLKGSLMSRLNASSALGEWVGMRGNQVCDVVAPVETLVIIHKLVRRI